VIGKNFNVQYVQYTVRGTSLDRKVMYDVIFASQIFVVVFTKL